MSRTPERVVKDMVKKVFAKYGDELSEFWPVLNGMGTPALDCIGCINGYHFEIETKAPGGKPSPRQKITIAQKEKAGAKVFVIDGARGCAELEIWLDVMRFSRGE